jgi:flagellar biosynthesis regulator FlaF
MATVSAGLAPGKSINDGIEAMERIKTKILDDTFTTDLEGNLEILLRVVLILICIWVGFIIIFICRTI